MAYVLGLPFSRLVLLPPVFACHRRGRHLRRTAPPSTAGFRHGDGHRAAAPGAGALLTGGYGYDAVSMWALKAKVAFFARTWPAPCLTRTRPIIRIIRHWCRRPRRSSSSGLDAFDDVASRAVFAAWFAAGAAILWWWLGHGAREQPRPVAVVVVPRCPC